MQADVPAKIRIWFWPYQMNWSIQFSPTKTPSTKWTKQICCVSTALSSYTHLFISVFGHVVWLVVSGHPGIVFDLPGLTNRWEGPARAPCNHQQLLCLPFMDSNSLATGLCVLFFSFFLKWGSIFVLASKKFRTKFYAYYINDAISWELVIVFSLYH